jgi:hypothetical protein
MRLTAIALGTAAGLLGLGMAAGALLLVSAVATERTLTRGAAARLLRRR